MNHLRKELKDLMSIAKKQGWGIVINKHIRWEPPQGDLYFSSRSPSDWRVLKNIRRDLKNRGLKI